MKIIAQAVPADQRRPHGVNYSLTLHRPTGDRVMGYDNAHSIWTGNSSRKILTMKADHQHHGERVTSYDYVDAQSLLKNFWDDVNKILKAEGIP
ncbi:toxin-antitoxin system TumE family protein [Skermanella stibiiresistens]|uniref:toxin-antitoxin system TumE family protein n=1 Tax=Skermanella stibiiresistens TaxID=913326 RepID=UPI0012F74879|nr:DUF6516 family protein [Skermanella stibiiresistens]